MDRTDAIILQTAIGLMVDADKLLLRACESCRGDSDSLAKVSEARASLLKAVSEARSVLRAD